MDILDRKWSHFLALAEVQNLTACARKLRLTPPALSISIKSLEQEAGIPLFIRYPREMRLTKQGEKFYIFLKKEERLLQQNFRESMSEQTNSDPREVLRIGVVMHLAQETIIPSWRAFKKEFSPFQVFFGYSAHILDSVKNGDMDLGLIGWTKIPKNVRSEYLGEDELAIAGQKSQFKHIEKAKTLEDLRDEPWIWHRMPQKSWQNYLEKNEESIVVDTYDNLKPLLFAGVGIAEIQLKFFSKAERNRLAFAAVSAPSRVGIYLVMGEKVSDRVRNAAEKLSGYVKFAEKLPN